LRRALAEGRPVRNISTRKYIVRKTGTSEERLALQAAGDELDRRTAGGWVADAVAEEGAGVAESTLLLVDSARIAAQVTALRVRFGKAAVRHVHLTAPEQVLQARYMARASELREFATYAEARTSPTEAAVDSLAAIADAVVDTSVFDLPSQVAYALEGWTDRTPNDERLVDVFVGAQWGSEGKGNVCSYLAREYDVLMRVGGPNAGHKVADPKYDYIQLPAAPARTRKPRF